MEGALMLRFELLAGSVAHADPDEAGVAGGNGEEGSREREFTQIHPHQSGGGREVCGLAEGGCLGALFRGAVVGLGGVGVMDRWAAVARATVGAYTNDPTQEESEDDDDVLDKLSLESRFRMPWLESWTQNRFEASLAKLAKEYG
ncbi:hypothetical protein Tco_0849590 [Tanacetum coccineum]